MEEAVVRYLDTGTRPWVLRPRWHLATLPTVGTPKTIAHRLGEPKAKNILAGPMNISYFLRLGQKIRLVEIIAQCSERPSRQTWALRHQTGVVALIFGIYKCLIPSTFPHSLKVSAMRCLIPLHQWAKHPPLPLPAGMRFFCLSPLKHTNRYCYPDAGGGKKRNKDVEGPSMRCIMRG